MYSFRESANNGEYSYVTLRERQTLDEIHSDVGPGKASGGGGMRGFAVGTEKPETNSMVTWLA